MVEIKSNPIPDVEKPSDEVINKIISLYFPDNEKVFHGEKGGVQRDESWISSAEKLPFSDKIKALDEVKKAADIKRKKFPDIARHEKLFLGHVEDKKARKFLGDFWCIRIIPFSNYMETGYETARDMIGEMEIKSDLCGGPFKNVKIKDAIRSVLENKLKPIHTPQPKQPKQGL